MAPEKAIPIRLLQPNQKAFTIRIKANRVGYETLCGSNFSTKIRKLIMVDEEGVRIGVLIFNDDIAKFAGKIAVNKTYLIKDPIVKRVNQQFPNAHWEKELVLTKHTLVEEDHENIEEKTQYNFVAFREINPNHSGNMGVDVYGIVIKVKECRMTTNKKAALKTLREVTIIDSDYIPIVICLWDDMATNEGGALQEMAVEYPIIAISGVVGKKYQGELQLQTTSASILQINPQNEKIESLRKWFEAVNDPSKLHEMAATQRIKSSKEVSLHQLIHQRDELQEDTYYYFRGIVDGINNKSSIWYDSCKKCSASVSLTGDSTSCRKCNTEDVDTIPRYRLVVDVVQGDDMASVTMFEDVAATFVGCPVTKYLESIEKGEQASKYYRELSLKSSSEYHFLFVLTHRAQMINGRFQVVADAIEKIPPPVLRKTRKRSAPENVKIKKMGKVEHSHGSKHYDKNFNSSVESQEARRTVTGDDASQRHDSGGQLNEIRTEIQLSSDDDATLSTFKRKLSAKTQKSSGKDKSTEKRIKRKIA